MKIGNNNYVEKTLLINIRGYYIDYLIDKVPKENFVSLEKLNEITETKILLYPSFYELESNFETIINKPIILVLRAHQLSEIKMFLPYFRDQRFNFDKKDFFDFLGIEFLSDNELFERCLIDSKFISVYLFLKQFDEYHFNPSYFKAMFTKENWMYVYPLAYYRFEPKKKPNFDNYLKNNSNPNNEIALRLLFYDFTGEITDETIVQFIIKKMKKNYEVMKIK